MAIGAGAGASGAGSGGRVGAGVGVGGGISLLVTALVVLGFVLVVTLLFVFGLFGFFGTITTWPGTHCSRRSRLIRHTDTTILARSLHLSSFNVRIFLSDPI